MKPGTNMSQLQELVHKFLVDARDITALLLKLIPAMGPPILLFANRPDDQVGYISFSFLGHEAAYEACPWKHILALPNGVRMGSKVWRNNSTL